LGAPSLRDFFRKLVLDLTGFQMAAGDTLVRNRKSAGTRTTLRPDPVTGRSLGSSRFDPSA
jgi:hypothetical protein